MKKKANKELDILHHKEVPGYRIAFYMLFISFSVYTVVMFYMSY